MTDNNSKEDLVRQLVNAHAVLRQREGELSDALEALRGLCRATGEESYEEGLEIWMRADEVLALHDSDVERTPGTMLCSGGCGKWIPYQYCDECSKTAKCHHGNPLDCNDCMVEGDLAYDAGRA